jgi:hypothetical protein
MLIPWRAVLRDSGVAVVTHAKMSVRTHWRCSGLRYVLVPAERQPAGIDLTCRSLCGTVYITRSGRKCPGRGRYLMVELDSSLTL